MSIFSKSISTVILFVSFFPLVTNSQIVSTGSINAYQKIESAQQAMIEVDNRLREIEQLGGLPTTSSSSVMQVSLKEISEKIRVSRSLLDQSLDSYTQGNFFKSHFLADRSRQNTILVELYLDTMLRRSSSLGVSNLELQGTLAQLLGLRQILQLQDIPNPPIPNPSDNQSGGGQNTDNDPVSEEENEPEPEIDPPFVIPATMKTCVQNGLNTCSISKNNCDLKTASIVNSCSSVYDPRIESCNTYGLRAETYSLKCQATLDTCLATKPAQQVALCESRSNTCQTNAEISRNRDLTTQSTCREKASQKCGAYGLRAETYLPKCESNLATCLQTNPQRASVCQSRAVTCREKAVLSREKDLNTMASCEIKEEARCATYGLRAETYSLKCQATLDTCLATKPAQQVALCESRSNTCQTNAEISRNRDLTTQSTCLNKQTSAKNLCNTNYSNRIESRNNTCSTNYSTCQTRVLTRCAVPENVDLDQFLP